MGLKVRKQDSTSQASRIFTDREEPRKSFWKKYDEFKTIMHDDDVRVLAYYGIGGIGKSSLLKKLISEMDEKKEEGSISKSSHVYFDFNISQECRSILESIRKKLVCDYNFDFPLFDIGCYAYAQKIGVDTNKPTTKTFIERSRTLDFLFDLAKELPLVGFAAKIIKLADKGFAACKDLIQENKDVVEKIENKSSEELYDYLPCLFAKDLAYNVKNNKEPLVIFLDTYEQLVNEMAPIGEPLNKDLWLRDEKNGLIVNTPNVLWVIAGREKLKWQQFTDWGESLEQHILGSLSKQDAATFLKSSGINDEMFIEGIYNLTQGTPVYLDLCVDRYNSILEKGEKPKIEHFGQNIYTLIERFARYMDDSKKDIVYILACLKNWTDEMVLEIGPRIIPNFSSTTYEKVKGFSFVIQSDKSSYNLHQTVGDSLYKNCTEIIQQRTCLEAIEYCTNKLNNTNVFSNDFDYYTGWLLKYAISYYKEDDALRIFYIDNIRVYLKKLSDVYRFNSIDDLFTPFWDRASQNPESRLFALAQKDYSIWLQSKGKYQQALDLAKRSYDSYLKLLGPNDAATLRAQREYAAGLHNTGAYKEALEIRAEILKRRIVILGENNLETIESYVDMSKSYGEFGLYEQKMECAKKIFNLRKQLLAPNDPKFLLAKNNFSKCYRLLGQNDKAHEISLPLIKEAEEILGKEHEITLDIIAEHTSILATLGRYEEVLSLRKTILERRMHSLGENHPKTIAALKSLASAYDNMGHYADALPLRQSRLKKCRTLYGELHPKTLKASWGLAYNLEKLGRYQEALNLRKEIYEKYKQTQGEDFPDTIDAYANIAINYKNLGLYDKALEIRKNVFEKRKVLLGDEHPDTITAQTSLASAYDDMGHYADALPLRQSRLEKCRSLYGELHPKTLKALWGIASNLEDLGQYPEALTLRKEIYEKYKQTQGEDFPDTIDAYANIARNYKNLGLFDKALEIRKAVFEKNYLEISTPTLLTQ
ncbi:tetratricopeptide repeat protein [uncultured Fibrobacter sp.]|uniref:tetratricopeptide repeat protein n=1 Tax=uncultured Fibrobacter sp. TaxID=261512 RepID=UPI002621D32B|nr:tetratricopeptide repeat protein [uncultured Fibrobacter sp.]